MDQKTETDIIARVLNGDRRVYAKLIEEYKTPIFNLAYRMTGNPADAEDLTQETFIRAYKYLWRYHSRRKFFTWLYTISYNLVKNHIKKNRASSRQIVETDILSLQQNNTSPEERLIKEQEINFYLLRVPHELRGLLIMKYHQDLSFEEIAEITGKSVSAVKMSIYRGLESMKQMIKD